MNAKPPENSCGRSGGFLLPPSSSALRLFRVAPAFRWACWAVCLIFLFEQTVFSEPGAAPFDYSSMPGKSAVQDPAVEASAQTQLHAPPQLPPTQDFLADDSPLSRASQKASGDVVPPGAVPDAPDETERAAFEEAVEQLRPEYASAVIVKDLTESDLRQLENLSFETGILVLHGEIVLFTSGSEDEIGVLPAAKVLAGKSALISHTHPGIYSEEGPSGEDINEAVSNLREAYVLTRQGVYAYSGEGVINDGNPYSYEWYLGKINQALEDTQADRDQVAARRDLNEFIKAQDEYNEAPADERVTFQRGGTLSYTGGLTASSVTTLAGSPYPYISTGSSAGTTLSHTASTNQFALGYNVAAAGTTSGFSISFDNAGTTAVETQNISALTYLTFGLKGPNTTVGLQIVDVNGNKDLWTLTNISNATERFWRIPTASVAGTVDKTRIKQINFIVSQANTTSATRTGTLSIRSKGEKTSAPPQPVVTSSVPAITNQTTLTLSGTKEANTSILINNVQVVSSDASTTWSATVNLGTEGNNMLNVTAKNSIGLVSSVRTLTVLRDTVKPTGSVNINAGAAYTAAGAVTLNLSASDGGSRLSQMSFSTDNVTWSAAEAYATSKAWTLPAGDGPKTVYVRYVDRAGNVSAVYSKSIILDTLPPSGTMSVNGGARYVTQTAVTLNLSAVDAGSGLDKMSFSSNGTTWTAAQAYAATKAWTFGTGDGNKTVYVKFLDKSGKWSAPVSVTVLLDTVKPTGSVNINSGAAYAASATVTLNLSAADAGSGVGTVSFSTDNSIWTMPEAYATAKIFSLPSGNGNKTVYVKYYDKAGNVSAVYPKSITLDTSVPTGSININSGAAYATSAAVTLTLSATDAGSGISAMSFSTNGAKWTTPETYASSRSFVFPATNGTKTVYVKYYDKAGNVSAVYSKSVVLDTLPPSVSVSLVEAPSDSNGGIMTAKVDGADSGAGVARLRWRTGDDRPWSDWVVYQSGFQIREAMTPKNWMSVEVQDKAGNSSFVYFDTMMLGHGSVFSSTGLGGAVDTPVVPSDSKQIIDVVVDTSGANFQAFQSQGLVAQSFAASGEGPEKKYEYTYYPSGKLKSITTKLYFDGKETEEFYSECDEQGNPTRYIHTLFYPDGTSIFFKDDYRYADWKVTEHYYSVYDSAGVLQRNLHETFYPGSGYPYKTKVWDDDWYRDGKKVEKYYMECEESGVITRYSDSVFNTDGVTLSFTYDYRYSGGEITDFYYDGYDTAGIRTQAVHKTYFPGNTWKPKSVTDAYYAQGKKTKEYYGDLDAAGVTTRYMETIYYGDGVTVHYSNDYRYANGEMTVLYNTIYDATGVIMEVIHKVYPPGNTWKPKNVTDTLYSKGKKTKEMYGELAASGATTRYMETIFYDDGVTIEYSNDYRYAETEVTDRYYFEYDSAGVLALSVHQVYQPGNTWKTKVWDETRHVNGVKTTLYSTACDAVGARLRYFIETYDPNGQALASDEYIYQSGKLKKRTYVTRDSQGKIIDSSAVDYPLTVYADMPVVTLNFSVDGTAYHQVVSFSGDSQLFQQTVTGSDGLPVIVEFQAVRRSKFYFTSPSTVDQSAYTLTYDFNGANYSEMWTLRPGANQILVRGLSAGGGWAYAQYEVTLNQAEPSLPAMPVVPVLPEDLMEMKTQDGLVLKYQNGQLLAVENPGVYRMSLPELDAAGNPTGGLVVFENGDRLLFKNSKAVYRLNSDGQKLVYDSNGRVITMISSEGNKTRFDYRTDAAGNVLSVLGLEDSVTSLYDAKGVPVWILKKDGAEMRYENGRLKEYRDAAGNFFYFTETILQNGTAAAGYRTEISSIYAAGPATIVTLAEVLANASLYPSVIQSLNLDVPRTIEYDAAGQMQKAVSGKGEILQLNQGLPVSLTASDGQKIDFNVNAASGAIRVASSTLGQVYDDSGILTGIRLSDGTVLSMNQLKLDRIELTGGGVIQGISWAGSALTGFTHVYPDGSEETYENGLRKSRTDTEGNRTTYILYEGVERVDQIFTSDGRTYQIIESTNADGLTDRVSNLRQIDLPDGSKITFEPGKPVQYIRNKQVTLDAAEVPELSSDQLYLSSLAFNNLELRGVTIDSLGNILAGEILFYDGTQYFIRDGNLLKQITPSGQVIEFGSELIPALPPPAPITAVPLTSAETAYRNQLVDAQLDYFVSGVGLDPLTGLPVDNYSKTQGVSDYSQVTLVGFWAEILAAIARGDYVTSKMSREQALERLAVLVNTYRDVQMQAGWNGLVSFFTISFVEQDVLDPFGKPTGQKSKVPVYKRKVNDLTRAEEVGLGDVLNLAVSLSSVIGALSNFSYGSSGLDTTRAGIVATGQTILNAQDQGYSYFYDSSSGRFRMVARIYANQSYALDGYMDRVFNEFRTGMFWLAARKPAYLTAVRHLDVAIRPYSSANGQIIDNAVPFDGGAFQMFWPLIHVDETRYPEFDTALRNFMYSQADYANKTGNPGLLSAGDQPGGKYEGKIGMPEAAETDDPLLTNIGSLYGTASAFGIAPHYTLQFLKNLLSNFPEIRTSAGFADSLTVRTVTNVDPATGKTVSTKVPTLSSQYYGVDQASMVLSLLKTSQNYFSDYLAQTGTAASVDAIYQGFSFGLNPADRPNPAAPVFNGNVPALYDGTDPNPDKSGYSLIKQAGFISSISDPELGAGKIYHYLTPEGRVHHSEIEFESSSGLKRMSLQEFLLLPGRSDAARSLFESLSFDLLGDSQQMGGFYTEKNGFADCSLRVGSELGDIRKFRFDLRDVSKPVGLWANYGNLDLSQYDYISIPVRLDQGTPEGIRLKFELKGIGEIYVTPDLTDKWQYVQIPILRSSGKLTQIAISVQSPGGKPAAGTVLLGPLSAFKVRTSNNINWMDLTGKSVSEMRTLLKQQALEQPGSGGEVTRREILENFVLDADGKLVSGTLRHADGSVQYFKDGRLHKWIFPNGRTVLFAEDGLASFILDLSRGRLVESRYYYDQTFRGEIESMVVQDNDRKRVYDRDGNLLQIVESGRFVNFRDGRIDTIVTDTATLSHLIFGSDGSLLKADGLTIDGRAFTVDMTQEQVIDRENGVKVYYKDNRVTAVYTPQNGRTDLTYRYDANKKLFGIDVSFKEIMTDPVSGLPVEAARSESLFAYIYRAGRELEAAEILQTPRNQLSYGVGSFASPYSIPETPKVSLGAGCGNDASVCVEYTYNSPGIISGVMIGKGKPVSVGSYDFLLLRLMQDPSMTWPQDFKLFLKDVNYQVLNPVWSVEDVPGSGYKTFAYNLAGLSGNANEISLELVKESAGLGKTGKLYFQDAAYVALKKYSHPLWEDAAGISISEIQNLRSEGKMLASVGAQIASGKPLVYTQLKNYLDAPTQIAYHESKTGTGAAATVSSDVTSFRRFDGANVNLDHGNVTRVVLPDGTVNEYSASENSAQTNVTGTDSQANAAQTAEGGQLNYRYGALRKITQADGRIYDLSYEFDGQGNQVTVMTDESTGEVRKFKDGKLLQSASAAGVLTDYQYENGELIGSELLYKNRVLNSASYRFSGEETQITDDDGTTWYYDANGNLKKHLTKDGYLYAYSDYSATLPPLPSGAGEGWGEGDYKRVNVFDAAGLRAVTLTGYEAQDGSQLKQAGEGGLYEIDLPSGDKAVNVELDGDRKIKSGQIQFANGLIVVIENYVPVSGRLADKSLFTVPFPEASTDTRIVQDEAGAYTGSLLKINGKYYAYDAYGYLKKIENANGETYQFAYQTNTAGALTSYDALHHKQLTFGGVLFPKELSFSAGDKLTLKGPDGVIAEKTGGSGFLIASYDDSANTWKTLAGQLASDGDRIALKNFLTNLKKGQYSAVMVSDPNFSKMDEDTLALLEGIGAGNVRQARASGQNWYLFGNEFLDKGKGGEKTGGSSFSTVTEDTTHVSITGVADPKFDSVSMILNIPRPAADAYSLFLKACEKNKLRGELQAVAVYSAQNEIVYSEQLDGTRTFYDKGKPRETYTRTGELLYTQEYSCPSGGCAAGTEPTLAKVTLVKARQDFESQVLESREQIARVEFDALLELAEQHAVAVATIEQEVNNAVSAIDGQIRQLEAARYQTVKECKKVLFWKVCSSRTFEVPGVKDQIDQLSAQKAELLSKIRPEQIASVPGLIAAKKTEIETATAAKQAELAEKEQSVYHDILQRELAPVLSDIYRRLLGRDPSNEELEAEIKRVGSNGALDLTRTVGEIKNSLELQKRAADKAAILGGVRSFLGTYVSSAGDTVRRTQLIQSLKLESSEAVDLGQDEVNTIMTWLEARDLHFGQSAFLSLKTLLTSRSIDVDLVTLGTESILIDILTGTLNKFAEGDLLLSVFALGRVAKVHGADITGVAYTLDDLKALYANSCAAGTACSLRVIAHVSGNHYVVITSVTADSITFIEPNKGADGGLVTETFDQFRQSWNPAGGTGYLVMFRDKAVASKTISDETAKRIRGAFFGIDLIFWFTVASIALTVASVAVSYISPALGKILGYAAMVAGIVAIAASVVNFVVAGFQTMLTAVSNFNNLGLLQSIQQGFSMLGNAIWSGVSHIGDWIRGGFNFVKGVFTGGFGGLSAGITSMKQFAVDGIQLLKNPAGGLIRQNLTFAQIVGRSMIAAAINLPLSKGLEGLGIDSTMARLAGAFVSGGLVGLGGGAAGFFSSGVQMYLLQGVSEIGMHLNLPPPITQAVSLAVTSSLASYFDPSFNLKTYLPQIFKDFSKQLTMGGIDLIGRSMGMKPWLTGLIKIPAAAAVGGIVDTLMHPSTGVSSLWQTIKNAVLSPQTVGGLVSVGANIALDAMGIPQIAMDLVRGFLSGLGQTDAGKAIFEKIGAGINKFTGWITTGIGAVIDFGAKALGTLGQITKEGFQSAMRFFSRFFSQETQENIYKEETQIVGGKLVINGDEWKYYVGDSVITYNRQTDVIFDNSGVGSARLEGLGGDSTGKFTFKNISVEEVMAAGATLKQTYENGGLKEWRYQGAKGETMTVSAPTDVADQGQWISRSGQLENGKVVINIPGSDPEPNSGHDPLTTPAWYDWSVLTIQNKDGKIVRADTEYRFGQGAQSGGAGSTKPLYVLTNGINNDNYFGGAPLYLYALHDDLIVKSDGQIGVDDVAVAKDYPPLQLLGIGIVQYLLAVATGGTIQLSTINQAHDIITLLQEMVDPTAEGAVTSEIRVGLNAFFFRYGQVNRSRSRIGVGYSGGFGPLEEVLIHDGVAISSMVAIGAALVNASDWVINKIIALLEAMDQGRYLDTGSILTEIKNAAFGTISLSASIIEDIVAKVRSGLIEPALTALRLGLQDIIKAFSPNIELPSLTSTSAQYVVNVWGSKDILANLGIGGYRETISGKPAINIRIEGADHYDYMKGIKPERLTDQKAKDWNDKVADFVARLVIASQSGPELTAFLNRQIDAGIVSFDGNIYQVNLPRQP